MTKVVIDIAMSLDGYVAGPNDSPEHGLGENGGGRIMGWDPSERLNDINRENTGAMITGKRTYDITNGWKGTHDLGGGIPVFVLTKSVPPEVPKGGTPFTFVTEGIESAVRQAKTAAGDKNVYVIGGASVIQQLLNARLADELRVHIAPAFVGDGIKLFKDMDYQILMAQTKVQSYAGVTHITYRLQ